jgi:hypothetical protein
MKKGRQFAGPFLSADWNPHPRKCRRFQAAAILRRYVDPALRRRF